MRMLLVALVLTACQDPTPPEPSSTPTQEPDRVEFQTTVGTFEIVLYNADAPITTENFLQYVDDGFYDGTDGAGSTIFHRIVPGFVIQGGGLTTAGVEKSTRPAIENEARDNRISNTRGTLSMARTNQPNSATSQFFVNVADNTFLDAGESTAAGYAVFGEVTDGMDVVDDIVLAPANGETPITPVEILSATRLTPAEEGG